MLDTSGYRPVVRICSTYCFSMAAVVIWMCLNVTFMYTLFVMLLSLHSDLWKLWKLVFHFFQKGNWCSVPVSCQPFGCEFFCKFHKEHFSFGRIFLFRIIYGISPFPSAETEGITVISSFSCPVVLTSTDFSAFVSSIVVLVGISRKTGILSTLSVCPKMQSCLWCRKLCSAGTILLFQGRPGSFSLWWIANLLRPNCY